MSRQALPWLAGVVVVAAVVVAALSARGGDDIEPLPAVVAPVVPREALTVAAEFVQTAVARTDLRRSWELAHPELRRGYTLGEWLTGTIPVQPLPGAQANASDFLPSEVSQDEVVLRAPVDPARPREDFFVGLRRHEGRWRVFYFAPAIGPPA